MVAASDQLEPAPGFFDAWRGAASYCILDGGAAPIPRFMATWLAWQRDPQGPRILHYVALMPEPPHGAAWLAPVAQSPELASLAGEVVSACWALEPGIQRLRLERGAVLLTLCIGEARAMLRALACEADALWLGSDAPAQTQALHDPDMHKALARHCRHGTRVHLGAGLADQKLVAGLRQVGFRFDAPGLGASIDGVYDPSWQLRREPVPRTPASQALVIGAGLAGAAVAASLALRGWEVQVMDAAIAPAQGTSSLPVGLLVPHVSADDAPLSRASRAGLRATLHAGRGLLREGLDWQPTHALREGQRIEHAAWIKPAELVRAWLAQPGIRFSGGMQVAGIWRSEPDSMDGAVWQALDGQGRVLAQAPVLVLCTAFGVMRVLVGLPKGPNSLPCDEVAGQVAWGPWTPALAAAAPGHPVSGHGHFIPNVPGDAGAFWLSGSTYERASLEGLDVRAGLSANQQRIAAMLQSDAPLACALIGDQFARNQVGSWAGQRCTSRDRFPIAGAWSADWPGLYLSAAMGSRGLSFAALCGELIAAQLHGEPMPMERALAEAMSAQRFS